MAATVAVITGALLLINLIGRWANGQRDRSVEIQEDRRRGFPVVNDAETAASASFARPIDSAFGPDCGPGRYCVKGVVEATLADITLHVDAESLANAKVKAELQGVVVTAIEKQA